VNSSDQQRIFTAVESSFKKIFNKQKDIHIRKFSHLKSQQNRASTTPAPASKKFILNLSRHVLTDSEESGFEFFGITSSLEPGYGMCGGISCLQASTDQGHGIQVES
jgi:hypothetical protein